MFIWIKHVATTELNWWNMLQKYTHTDIMFSTTTTKILSNKIKTINNYWHCHSHKLKWKMKRGVIFTHKDGRNYSWQLFVAKVAANGCLQQFRKWIFLMAVFDAISHFFPCSKIAYVSCDKWKDTYIDKLR